MEFELISIVVPVYNAEKYLPACVESILRQDYDRFELILVDDGSTDGSFAICERYAEKDARVRCYTKSNAGVSDTRNFGIDHANGRYLTFIDSDDYVEPDYCSRLMQHADPGISAVVLGMKKVRDGDVRAISHRLKPGRYAYDVLKDNVIDDGTASGFTLHSSCATLFDLSLIRSLGLRFKVGLRYNEDGLFNAIYFLKAQKDAYIDYDTCVYFYRTNPDSSTQTVDLLSDGFAEAMNTVSNELTAYCRKAGLVETVDRQLSRRQISLFLNEAIYRAERRLLSYRAFTDSMKKYDVRRNLAFSDYGRMKFLKRTFLRLIWCRLAFAAFCVLKLKK